MRLHLEQVCNGLLFLFLSSIEAGIVFFRIIHSRKIESRSGGLPRRLAFIGFFDVQVFVTHPSE